MSSMAARLSAERPSLNAATRSCRGPLVGPGGSIRRAMIRFPARFLGESQCALINFAARQPGCFRYFADGVLERGAGKGLPQQHVRIADFGAFCRRRPDDQHELAAHFRSGGAFCKTEKVAAPD